MSGRLARTIFVAAFLALICIAQWLVAGGSSPFRSYFPYHVTWPNRLATANLPAFLIGAILSGNIHAPADWALIVGFLVRWLPIAYILSFFIVRKKPQPTTSQGSVA